MFQCGEYVMYSIHGACRIIAVEQRRIDKKTMDFYVLTPIDQPRSAFYVPTNNEAALSKMRAVLTADELHALISRLKKADVPWISDESKRRSLYKDLMSSGDRDALMGMLISTYKQRELMEKSGKRIHSCDENFIRDAKKLIDSEFSLVLQIPVQNVETYIVQALNE